MSSPPCPRQRPSWNWHATAPISVRRSRLPHRGGDEHGVLDCAVHSFTRGRASPDLCAGGRDAYRRADTLTGLEKPIGGGLRERYFGKGEAQVRAPPLPSPQPARVMIAAQAEGLGVTSLLFR
jgi:hypothetical protein